MRWLVVLACVLVGLAGTPAPAQKAAPVLTVVADEWPPFSGSNLPGQGMSLHVISAVLTQAGYRVEAQVLPWARIMDGARRGEFDIIGSLFYDEALTDVLAYSDPFYATDVQLVQPTGGALVFTSVPELRGYRIAVGDGFLYEPEFDAADYLDKVTVTTTLQALRMVAYGRADLTLDSVDVVNHSIDHLEPALRQLLQVVPGVMATQNIHMAARMDLPDRDRVLRDFNTVLEEMRADGSLDGLLRHHVSQ